MDILKLLRESKGELYPDDLDFFEQELVIGDYDDAYKTKCKNKIRTLRAELCKPAPAPPPKEKAPAPVKKAQRPASSGGVIVSLWDIVPQEAESAVLTMTPSQKVQNDLDVLREQENYKKAFKSYIKDSALIDSEFLDAHFSLFKLWELGVILSEKQLDEAFLEKYFGALDHEKIARYQLFRGWDMVDTLLKSEPMLRCFFTEKENTPKVVEKDMKALVSAKLGASAATMFFASLVSQSKALMPEEIFADDGQLTKNKPLLDKMSAAKKVQTCDLLLAYLRENLEFMMLNKEQFATVKGQLAILVRTLDASTRLLFAQNIAAATTDDGNSMMELLFEVFERDLIGMLDLSDQTRKLIEESGS